MGYSMLAAGVFDKDPTAALEPIRDNRAPPLLDMLCPALAPVLDACCLRHAAVPEGIGNAAPWKQDGQIGSRRFRHQVPMAIADDNWLISNPCWLVP